MTGIAAQDICEKCGSPYDGSTATYDKDGKLQCRPCAAKDQIAEGESRASASIVSAAVGVLFSGIVSLTCFNPVFVVSVMTLLSGVSWLVMVGRNDAERSRLGWKLAPCMIAVSIGVMLASFPLLVALFGILGFALLH
jgi:hypothetical protein